MRDGTKKLFASKKAARETGATPLTAIQQKQGMALLRRVSRGEGPAGGQVVPSATAPPVASMPSAPTEALPAVVPTENPSPVAVEPPATEKAAEDAGEGVWVDDPISLVLGEEDEGLLGEKVAEEETGSIYQSDDPHPLVLFRRLSDDFNRLEWVLWEPEALRGAMTEMSGAAPSEVVVNMAGALASLVESEAFWNEHHIFLHTADALNARVPNFATLPDLTPAEVALAVGVAAAVRDGEEITLPDGSTMPGVRFDGQVLATIAAIWHMAGLVYAPEPLDGANEYLEKLHDVAAIGLAAEVADEWGRMGDEEPELDDSALGLQLVRLAAIREYVHNPHA